MINTSYLNEFNSPRRKIIGKVELYTGSTENPGESIIFSHTDNLKEIKIERAGEESKFFGFGVPQKATIKIIDTYRSYYLYGDESFDVFFALNNNEFINNYPTFNVADVQRDENTNELTVVGQDLLYDMAKYKVDDLERQGYTIGEMAENIADYMGLVFTMKGFDDLTIFDTYYETGANVEGTETFREILDDVAEATQSIYYISGNFLIFRRLARGLQDLTISKASYFTLNAKEALHLTGICHTTELGDSVSSNPDAANVQYIRDNVFWEKRDDIADLVNQAYQNVRHIWITPFTCSWRGNFLLEIGDKLFITAKSEQEEDEIVTFVLNDTITYNGGFSQVTQWSYDANKSETASNPSSLGEVLKQTYARVDKANKQIELVVSEVSANASAISVIQQDTNSINATVSTLSSRVDTSIENNTTAIEEINKKVEAAMTDEQVQLLISSEIAKGTDKVQTSTGFTFNEEGLTVSKSGKEIKTQITEDGMTVLKDNTTVLTANNIGVDAKNLRATTYLIIGDYSRMENYPGQNRTACFWIGG